MELDIHFVCGRVVSNKLQIQRVFGTAQIVDALMKPLSTNLFQDFQLKLKVYPSLQPRACGEYWRILKVEQLF